MGQVVCAGCKKPVKGGQLVASVTGSDGTQVVGHYGDCLKAVVGPEAILRAIQSGELPNIDPASLIDGKLPKWAKVYPG